jgi:hypothetical protein
MISITYYAGLSAIVIDTSAVVPGDNVLEVNVTGRSAIVANPEKIASDMVWLEQCVVIISEATGKFLRIDYPPVGVTLVSTDQFLLFSTSVFLPADAVIDMSVVINEDAQQAVFTVPRPERPFPSWMWTDGQWMPPVPYPTDGASYSWDETAGAWVAL